MIGPNAVRYLEINAGIKLWLLEHWWLFLVIICAVWLLDIIINHNLISRIVWRIRRNKRRGKERKRK